MTAKRTLTTFLLTTLATALLAVPAHAGTATIYSCRNADGTPNAAEGWMDRSVGEEITPFSVVSTRAGCLSGTPLTVKFVGDRVSESQVARLTFEAPTGTRLTKVESVDRDTDGFGPIDGAYAHQLVFFDLMAADSGEVFESCAPSHGPTCEGGYNFHRANRGPFVLGGGESGLEMRLRCYDEGSNDHCEIKGHDVEARYYQVVVQISDDSAPVVTDKSGTMLTADRLTGDEQLSVSATDQGTGVYRAELLADDVVVDSTPVDDNGGACVDNDPTNGDPYEFDRPAPCKTSVSTTIRLDPRKLPSGTHNVKVRLLDATGNATVALNRDVAVDIAGATAAAAGGGIAAATDLNTVPVKNPDSTAADNGSPLDRAAVLTARFERGTGARRRTTSRITAGYHERVRVRGSITTSTGRPIAGARVFVAERLAGTGATRWKLDGGTVSRKDGSLLLFTREAGQSRDLRLVYFPRGGEDANRASASLALRVRQDARLTVDHRRLHNGQTLRFSGAVLGRLPRRGTAVRLQVLLKDGWFTFRKTSVGSGTHGRFAASYRFRRTTRPTVYRFRVQVVPAAARYAIGHSRTTSVRVTP